MKYNYYPSTKGITLIELLVVIAIIGILASITYVSFDQARAVVRDDVRQSDLKQLELAIELYKAQNGVYPEAPCGQGCWSGQLTFAPPTFTSSVHAAGPWMPPPPPPPPPTTGSYTGSYTPPPSTGSYTGSYTGAYTGAYTGSYTPPPPPSTGSYTSSYAPPPPPDDDATAAQYVSDLVPDYIKELPSDPRPSSGSGYVYRTNVDRTAFKLMARGSVEQPVTSAHPMQACDPFICGASCTDDGLYSSSYAVWGGAATDVICAM